MLVHIASDKSNSSLSAIEESQIQPNAVDLKLDRVWGVGTTDNHFEISETEKHHRSKIELQPDVKGFFRLDPGKTYEVQFEGTVKIGADEAGYVITRSTLNRNGLFFTSGLYDSGYEGAMAGALHNLGGYSFIKKGTRVAQFLLWKAEALHSYDGSYGIKDGVVKSDEQRYHEGK